MLWWNISQNLIRYHVFAYKNIFATVHGYKQQSASSFFISSLQRQHATIFPITRMIFAHTRHVDIHCNGTVQTYILSINTQYKLSGKYISYINPVYKDIDKALGISF